MKSILCYGDSNTYGFRPVDELRYDYEQRWTGILAQKLGKDYLVIEEGLNSRTTAFDDPIAEYKNGLKAIVPTIQAHWPVDLIIVMLGTNDLKQRFQTDEKIIAWGIETVIRRIKELHIQNHPEWQPKILLVSPILLGEGIKDGSLATAENFGCQRGYEIAQKLAPLYEKVAKRQGCEFLDAAKIAKPSLIDGIHMQPSEHQKLAAAFYDKIKTILG